MQGDYAVIKRPLITERSTAQRMSENKYSFEVARDATKVQIGRAVERLFSVKVMKVNTMTVKGKLRRLGAHEGMRPNWKKAIVTLKKGDTIKVFEGA
ncbi:MAG: 50S ribosomal protein L23 [bacterium]